MATNNIFVGLWKPDGLVKYNIEDVNMNDRVQDFKLKVKNTVGNSLLENRELSYAGVLMEDDDILGSYGVTPGVIIHLVEQKTKQTVPVDKIFNEVEIQELINYIKNLRISISFRPTVHRLKNSEEMDKVIAAVPGLENDPIAIVLLSETVFYIHMEDPKIVRKIVDKHPFVVQAIKYIATEFHKDTSTSSMSTQPSTSTGYSYSLEALSDDDEDMDSSSDTAVSQHPLTRNSSYNAITAAQLAAAIANATNTTFNTHSAGMPSTPNSSVITNEMISNAIQQAFAFGSTLSPTTPTTGEESLDAITRRLQPQLQQMREMGLVNDVVNLRALQATNGDVQAAIDLVFNGAID